MTRYEKLTLGVSILALVGAIASPFISFRLLDPQLQSFQNRALLQVTEVTSSQTQRPSASNREEFMTWLINNTYEIQIMNVGKLPAREVAITLQYGDISQNAFVELAPPILSDTSEKENLKFLTLKQPIAPQDKVTVKFRPMPDLIWVTNEYGERNTISTKTELSRLTEFWDLMNYSPKEEIKASKRSSVEAYIPTHKPRERAGRARALNPQQRAIIRPDP